MQINEFVEAIKEATGFNVVPRQNQEALNLTVYAYGRKLAFNITYESLEMCISKESLVSACSEEIAREMNNARNFAGKCEGCNP